MEVFIIPTIKQIADLAGVSRGTVDRVLNNRGYVNPETAQKVQKIVQALHYAPNRYAQALSIKKNNFKIGVILFSGSNKFFDDVIDGINSKARDLRDAGCSVSVSSCRGADAEGQLEAIDNMVQQGAQGLIISPINSKEIINKISLLYENNIPVITTNSDVANSNRLCYVGSNYYVSGQTAGALMGMITGGASAVGIITGFNSIQCHTERIAGFRDRIYANFQNVHIVDIVENQDDEFKSYTVTHNLLTKYTNITALYLTAGGVYGACRALVDLGLAGKLKVICHDDVPDTKKMILDGVVSATICQEPKKQGTLPVKLMFDFLAYGIKPSAELYFTDIIIKIKDNLESQNNVRP